MLKEVTLDFGGGSMACECGEGEGGYFAGVKHTYNFTSPPVSPTAGHKGGVLHRTTPDQKRVLQEVKGECFCCAEHQRDKEKNLELSH